MEEDKIILWGGTDVEIIVEEAQRTAWGVLGWHRVDASGRGCTGPEFQANTPNREYVFVCEKHAESDE